MVISEKEYKIMIFEVGIWSKSSTPIFLPCANARRRAIIMFLLILLVDWYYGRALCVWIQSKKLIIKRQRLSGVCMHLLRYHSLYIYYFQYFPHFFLNKSFINIKTPYHFFFFGGVICVFIQTNHKKFKYQ